MSWLDADNDEIVVRIVYAGPADSGKTTSIRKLAKLLLGGKQTKVHTPEEIGGQTMYFDWLDYTGGLFQGKRIRCQILSTPGQDELAKRRQYLLESADVCVFVFSSNTDELKYNHNYFLTINKILKKATPDINVVFQANKQDLPEAQDEASVRAAFGIEIEKQMLLLTSAIDGQGIREAFVSAVRLALERAIKLQLSDSLDNHPPFANDPSELLKRLSDDVYASESPVLSDAAQQPPITEQTTPDTENSPESVASTAKYSSVNLKQQDQTDNTNMVMPFETASHQLIYQNNHERRLHNEITCSMSFKREVLPQRWYITLERQWKIINNPNNLYANKAAARIALDKIKKITVALSNILSPQRWHLAAAFGDQWQIWQYVAVLPTLRSNMNLYIANKDSKKLATQLAKTYQLATEFTQKAWQYNPTLHISLDTISIIQEQPYYSGFLAFRSKSNLNLTAFITKLFHDVFIEIKQSRPQLFIETKQSISDISNLDNSAKSLHNILRDI